MVHMPFCCPYIIYPTPLQGNEKKPKSAAKKNKVKKGKKNKASFRRSHKKRPRGEPSVGDDGGEEEEAVVPHASPDEPQSESEAIWPKKCLWYTRIWPWKITTISSSLYL